MKHADQIVKLVNHFYHNQDAFTGLTLQRNTPEEIRKKMLTYLHTAQQFYQWTGTSQTKLVDLAEVVYRHNIALPKAALTDLKVAQDTFLNPPSFLGLVTAPQPLFEGDRLQNLRLANVSTPETKAEITQANQALVERINQKVKQLASDPTAQQAYQTQVTTLLNNHTRLMASLRLIQASDLADVALSPAYMKTFLFNHLNDVLPLAMTPDDEVQVALATRALITVTEACVDRDKSWLLGSALNTTEPKKMIEALETLFQRDLQVLENNENTVKPEHLFAHWVHNTITSNLAPPHQEGNLFNKLADCIVTKTKSEGQAINELKTLQNIKTFMETYPFNSPEMSRFTMKRLVELCNAVCSTLKLNGAGALENALGLYSSHADTTYRFNVGLEAQAEYYQPLLNSVTTRIETLLASKQ
jgi:hypothetical protein